MMPRVYRLASPEDVARMASELRVRIRVAGPSDAYVSQAGGGTEFSAWQRRYRKLVALLAEQAVEGGKRYSARVWDLTLKGAFLLPEELTLADGRVYRQAPSTKTMTREERAEYLARVREFAAERGIFLSQPEEETT